MNDGVNNGVNNNFGNVNNVNMTNNPQMNFNGTNNNINNGMQTNGVNVGNTMNNQNINNQFNNVNNNMLNNMNNGIMNNNNVNTNINTSNNINMNNMGMNNNLSSPNVVDNRNNISNDYATNNSFNGNVDMGASNKKTINKSLLIGLIVVVGIILLGGIGFFVYKSYVDNPVNLYSSAIDVVYEKLSDTLDFIEDRTLQYNFLEDSIVMDANIKVNSNMPELNEYTKYNYDLGLGLDIKNSKMQYELAMNEDAKEIIGAIISIMGEKLYVESEQIYDKTLYGEIDYDMFEEFKTIEMPEFGFDDIDLIARKISNSIKDSLVESEFSKENEEIELNGKNIKATKVIYNINAETMYSINKNILEDVKNDEEFIEILSRLTMNEKSEIKEELKDVEISKEDYKYMEEYKIAIYTTGFFSSVVGFEIYDEYTTLSYVFEKGMSDFIYKTYGTKIVINTKDGVSTGYIEEDKEKLFDFKLVTDEKKEKFDLELTSMTEDEEIKIMLGLVAKKLNDKRFESSLNIDLNVNYGGEKIEFGTDIVYNISVGEKLSEVNTSNVINMDSPTDEEINTIKTNIENALKDTFWYDLIFGTFYIDEELNVSWENYDDDYDDDYYYEY